MKLIALLLFSMCFYFSRSLKDGKECTQPGPLCETCQSLVACVETNGIWTKNPVATCKAPNYCVNGACTSDYDPFCWGTADLAFPCAKAGIFPDPFYCNKFVLCVQDGTALKAFVNICEAGFGFNLATDLCDTKLENGQCPEGVYPVPICGLKDAGKSGAMEQKKAMYYLCEERTVASGTKVNYPYLDLCSGDFIYNEFECTNPTTPTTEGPSTTTTPVTLPPTTVAKIP